MENGKKYITVTNDHKPNSPKEIIRIKNDITRINTKMAKIEVEKSKILRWVYLQIKLIRFYGDKK